MFVRVFGEWKLRTFCETIKRKLKYPLRSMKNRSKLILVYVKKGIYIFSLIYLKIFLPNFMYLYDRGCDRIRKE